MRSLLSLEVGSAGIFLRRSYNFSGRPAIRSIAGHIMILFNLSTSFVTNENKILTWLAISIA